MCFVVTVYIFEERTNKNAFTLLASWTCCVLNWVCWLWCHTNGEFSASRMPTMWNDMKQMNIESYLFLSAATSLFDLFAMLGEPLWHVACPISSSDDFLSEMNLVSSADGFNSEWTKWHGNMPLCAVCAPMIENWNSDSLFGDEKRIMSACTRYGMRARYTEYLLPFEMWPRHSGLLIAPPKCEMCLEMPAAGGALRCARMWELGRSKC